ncbi:hypothetical protein CEXT_750521 [Caerostris extrusa]|uniref:Uncharacterized protein n=1 Tax=Caerostris extrusa TaxID=172846 RepID=A0AAV4TL48_CAEEX|nr:hypothetical protein CEXT_750521 [Caerostris extrusa]
MNKKERKKRKEGAKGRREAKRRGKKGWILKESVCCVKWRLWQCTHMDVASDQMDDIQPERSVGSRTSLFWRLIAHNVLSLSRRDIFSAVINGSFTKCSKCYSREGNCYSVSICEAILPAEIVLIAGQKILKHLSSS